jgi:sulfur carrier protein ThiS
LKELFESRVPEGSITLQDGSTLKILNEYLGISVNDRVVMLVNGAAMNQCTILQEGDQVDIFTPLSGG